MRLQSMMVVAALLLGGAARADEASELWTAKCKNCHGEDGRAKTRMGEKEKIADFTNPDWQKHHTDAQIREVITNGSPDNAKMKPYKAKLTPEQIDLLVKYIRNFGAASHK